MAITGSCLAFFILIHLLGNSTTFWGATAFNSYATHLHSLGFFVEVFEVCLFAIFALHIIFAIFLYFENITARSTRYLVQNNAGGRTLGSRTMPYTGLIILLFIIMHLTTFHGSRPESLSLMVRSYLSSPWPALYYIFSLIALIIHLSHGLWSIMQSLGLNSARYDLSLKKGAQIISITGGLIFIAIPLSILLCPAFLQ